MLSFTVGKNDAGQRADKFLLKATTAPPSLIYRAFRKKDVKIGGKWIPRERALAEGETLTVYVSGEFARERSAPAAPAEVELAYEDENIAVLVKPSGLPSQPDAAHADALSERFKAYLIKKGEYDPAAENSFSPALCNRLDTNTAGLVIGAKTAEALREMNAAIRERKVRKLYLCRTEGVPSPASATLRSTIKKDPKKNKSAVGSGGREIVTAYRVLKDEGATAVIEVELKTGRSHQIRAQLAAIGHPIVGDGKYGAAPREGGQRLAAYKLIFCADGFFAYLKGKEITVRDAYGMI